MFTKTPDKAWICIKAGGNILYEHCSCMAGLGGVCSHVGAIMFYLLLTSENCRRNSGNACTLQPCSWPPPSLTEVEFAELSNINFSYPRKRLSKNKVNAPKQALRNSEILRITSGFCERFPQVAEIRTALFHCYHEKYEQLLYPELIDASVKEYVKININTNELQLIEKKTKE